MDKQCNDYRPQDGDRAHLTVKAEYADQAWHVVAGHGEMVWLPDDSDQIVRVEPEGEPAAELSPDEESRLVRHLAAEAAAQILAPRSPLSRGTLAGHVDEVIRLAEYLVTGQPGAAAAAVTAPTEGGLSIGWGARIRATVTLLDEDPIPSVRLVFAPAFEGDEEPWVIHPGDQRRMPSDGDQRRMPSDSDPRTSSGHLSDVVVLYSGEPA